jgi:prepilin-type processing-associated H-X9-DG protein
MHRLRYVLFAIALLLLAGLVIPFITRGRVNSDRIGCQNHLRELGFLGVRHASAPGREMPGLPREELPPGTFLNSTLKPEDRMSWYVYTLNVLDQGAPTDLDKAKRRRPAGLPELLAKFDADGSWNAPDNLPLANYRLAAAVCPAQVAELTAGSPVRTNYVACGGLGVDTPTKAPAEAGSRGGAYWYDAAIEDRLFKDGLQQTAQIVETNTELGPWLQGGAATLRGLDESAMPYLGPGRPFGGCHPGGTYVSMADGSVQFVKDTVNPAVFRAMLTRAGGPAEQNFDAP